MSEQPSIRNHYGFSIEVHAGGRRVWPPSFKRFVRAKIESGELTTEDVTKECRVSKSLVYKWRTDVAQHRATFGSHPAKPTFSEVILDHADEPLPEEKTREEPIRLRGDVVVSLSKAQFEALLEGIDWKRVTTRHVRRPVVASGISRTKLPVEGGQP